MSNLGAIVSKKVLENEIATLKQQLEEAKVEKNLAQSVSLLKSKSESVLIRNNQQLKQQNAELLKALRKAREEFDKLPSSLGYAFDHIPAIDAAIASASN